MRAYRGGRRIKKKYKLILLLLVLVFFFAWAEAGIRSAVRTVSTNQARLIGADLINTAVSETLADNDVTYDSLVNVNYTGEAQVGAIEVDTIAIDRLRAQIDENLLGQLKTLDTMDLSVPLGTLLQSDLLTARGPKVAFKMFPSGSLESKIISEFDAAGINQTRHRIVLDIAVNVTSVVPFYRNQTPVHSEFVMAETIVVGQIPSYYTKVVSEDEQTISKINDYGAGQTQFKSE